MKERILKRSYMSKSSEDFKFLKELYDIMDKFNIHRIYRVSYKDGKLIDAHQTLEANLGNNNITISIFDFFNEYLPYLYFNIFYKIHIRRYKKRLKKLFVKYEIDTIGAVSFSLEQGLYISKNQFCICGVDIIKQTGVIFHIERLYLDI